MCTPSALDTVAEVFWKTEETWLCPCVNSCISLFVQLCFIIPALIFNHFLDEKQDISMALSPVYYLLARSLTHSQCEWVGIIVLMSCFDSPCFSSISQVPDYKGRKKAKLALLKSERVSCQVCKAHEQWWTCFFNHVCISALCMGRVYHATRVCKHVYKYHSDGKSRH